jgi:transmembrane sensor
VTDGSQRLKRLRDHSVPELSDGDIEGLMARADRRGRVRRARRAALAAVCMLAIGGGVGWRLLRTEHALRFADGSTADLVGAGSELSVSESSPTQMVVQVRKGGGRFDVARNPKRTFRVVARGISVEVIGTRFAVEEGTGDVRVSVERGRVRVRSAQGTVELAAGEARSFTAPDQIGSKKHEGDADPAQALAAAEPGADVPPSAGIALAAEPGAAGPGGELPAPEPIAPPAVEAPSAGVNTVSPPDSQRQRHERARHAAPAVTWHESAERHDYGKAYEQLRAQGMSSVRDVPEELLKAADVARLSGHPAEAVPLLQRAIKDHAKDPRAQLAAFTLGRVLLEELKRPEQAAAAFARARELAPRGPLAEDALFREAQCFARDGETRQAIERAKLYLKLYPDGSHRRAIERLGGLE